MKNPQDIINPMTREDTKDLMSCCMDNMPDEEVVEVIMEKVRLEDMFADELESAIQNYAAELQDDANT